MKPCVLFLAILCPFLMHSSYAQSRIGLFDAHGDIGDCKNEGFASYDPEHQTYTLAGSGSNMWFGSDEFHYLWTTLQGDFILRAEARFLGAGVDPHRKLGWIVKNDLAPNSEHVNASVHGDGLTALQFRKAENGDTESVTSQDSFPDVIQLERRGDTYIMSTARFGEPFTRIQVENLPMDTEVYVGLYVCSHDPDIMETAVFRNVRILKPASTELQPYRDYLGSNLELMDVATGQRKVIYRSAHSIQAPNWTVDGERLIYNSKGRLYNYHLGTGKISLLNTGPVVRNNNDHVLTFDGKRIGISSTHPEENASTIYQLPVEGDSNPVRVTRPNVGHSYLHGWSPDGKYMVFTGNRDGRYDIIRVDVETGAETRLTDLPTLDDGPEYSPDGRHIFFNSVRTGTMQLWRMDADGSDPIQLTFDEYNDWFPHISPDGKWILFISFPPDIDPSSHPFYKECLLRIMPYEGGEARVIGYIYGGQGTINVPSWSPDGKTIAFVTNGD